MFTGLPWDRKYVRPFRSALLSSPDLQVSSSRVPNILRAELFYIETGPSFAAFRRLHLRRCLHVERMSIPVPRRTQLRLGMDLRNVQIRAVVPRSSPDHRESDVVLRIQCQPPTGLAAQPQAPLRLPSLLRASPQCRARTR